MTTGEVISIVSACITFVGLIATYCALAYTIKNAKRADIKEIERRAVENAQVNVKLDSISSSVNDIKYDITATKKEVGTLNERMIKVESSLKSAHHRLNRIEGVKDGD